MATYTSTTNGNFSSSTTWGGAGVPADGDLFNVAAGTVVTIDTGISVPTNGYGDSYVYGILKNQASANTTLRMNGRLYIKSNGVFHLTDGALIQVKGGSNEDHGIWVENETNTHIIFEGSDPVPTTTVSANVGTESSSIPVASNSGFVVGEWIMAFDNHSTSTSDYSTDGHRQFHDEGFWIHDIDGTDIYIRNYVGPDDVTITNVRQHKVFVNNAKKFRPEEKIIFGTGANRNVLNIDSINYARNVLFCNTNVSNTSSLVGEAVYHSFTRKLRVTNDKIRKVATYATAAAANTTTSVTVASNADFAVGDDIYIERRSEADGSTDYAGYWSVSNFKDMRHTISSISGNTITVDATFDYNVVEGALVSKLSRPITFSAVTPTTDRVFFYKESQTSNYNPTIIIKDVYFKDWGSGDSNNWTGLVLRGHSSTNNPPVTTTQQYASLERGAWLEGITLYNPPTNAHERDWGPLWLYDLRGAKLRCAIVMNGDDCISAYYEPHYVITGCITTGGDSFGFRWEGASGLNELAYCYSSRQNYGYRFGMFYESAPGPHDLISDSCYYVCQMVGNAKGTVHRVKGTGTRYGIVHQGDVSMHNSTIKFLSGAGNTEGESGTLGTSQGGEYRSQNSRMPTNDPCISLEHAFEHDAVRVYGYNSESHWDSDEGAWRFYRRYDNDDNPAMLERVYVPSGVTMRVTAKIKLAPGFSGSYPYLRVVDESMYNYYDNVLQYPAGTGDVNEYFGHNSQIQYTSSATDYEEKQLTISARNKGQYYLVSVTSTNRNAAEGFWIKDFNIYLDTPYRSPALNVINRFGAVKNNGIIATIRNSFTQQKKRLGGRLK